MRTLPAACAASLAVSLLLAPAAPAFAGDGTYTIPLHQQADLPVTAASAPVPKESDCPVPAGMDGWHFVLPGHSTDFVKLTVTFQPGGQQVITSFGPPSDKHAYAASEPGARLTSAVAEVKGGSLEWFNLSHTCPAAGAKPTTPTKASPTATSPGTSGTGASTGTSGAPAGTGGASGGSAAAGASGGSPSVMPSASSSVAGKDLAETGASSTTGWLAGAALVLVAGGAMLTLRRRRASRG